MWLGIRHALVVGAPQARVAVAGVFDLNLTKPLAPLLHDATRSQISTLDGLKYTTVLQWTSTSPSHWTSESPPDYQLHYGSGSSICLINRVSRV
ncbi:uncharacterized protein BCR38DRAFT_424472 [Pseudomassariella vexata]|uniref:Uncharacterized protein n=1 Tax=Pseudomassariella vexata TaxID=1141098 RepID=A0A1Y2EB78_9PEZI|nr:uncharacterized protein BCR38DRAFT_424472 [Pseudomassariella vexata]ORY68833.1 hypothetical protein BCR38DRAFT_424472 [Pseudomassariella vexata]